MGFIFSHFQLSRLVRTILSAAACCAALTLVFDLVQAQSSGPAQVTIHMRLREQTADGTYACAREDREVEPKSNGRHRLRHVGRASLPERRASAGRDGSADERGAGERPQPRCAHHSRAVELHGAVQGPPGAQAGTGGSEGGEPARGHRRVVPEDSAEEKGKYPDRPDRRRRGRRPGRARAVAPAAGRHGPQPEGAVEDPDQIS